MKRIMEIKPGEGGDHARELAQRLATAYEKYFTQKG